MKALSEYPELLRLLREYSPMGQDYAQLILDIESRSCASDMIIPVLGIQGKGKSTLINGLLGENILPNDAAETTCIPVEIRYGEELCGIVHFLDGRETRVVHTRQELQQYVDNVKNPGNENQVSHIVLYRTDPLLKKGLVIVDLPGVGSLTRANEETTNRYIKNLCLAVFVISSEPVKESEAIFIKAAWRTFRSAYFVQNVFRDDFTTQKMVDEITEYNWNSIAKIAREIKAPEPRPLISVDALAAVSGAVQKVEERRKASNVEELRTTLDSYAENYQEQRAADFETRLMQLICDAVEQAELRIQSAQMTGEELLAAMEQEQRRFEAASEEVEDCIRSIKRELRAGEREIQAFASETGHKYAELLRVKTFALIDGGVVDGELLSSAFSDNQKEYASTAMDDAYEKLEEIKEKLQEKLEELDEVLQREELQSPGASAFNKAQAFKWEKGMEAAIDIVGAGLGAYLAFFLLEGPIGFLAAAAVGLISAWIGKGSRRAVTEARGREAKQQLRPYIEKFGTEICRTIADSYIEFAERIRTRLEEYRAAREEQSNVIREQIQAFKESGKKIDLEIETLERDKQYLKDWRAARD